MNWKHELHVPPHSADGQWRVIDADSDNGDVIAVVDPDDIAEGLGKRPEDYARLIASAPELEAFVAQVGRLLLDGEKDSDGAVFEQGADDAIDTLQSLIERARALTAEGGAE